MGSTLKIFFITIISIYSTMCWPQEKCDEQDKPESTRIYFTNGVNTPSPIAEEHLDVIKGELGSPNSISYGQTYNDDEFTLFPDLVEAVHQRFNETSKLWEYLNNLNAAPQWFRQLYAQKIGRPIVNADPDLQGHIQQYESDLHSGKKVVLVAHSQGSLYVNLARDNIVRRFPKYAKSIGIVAVGTPSSYVSGGGYYTTNSHDKVIKLIELFFPDTLNPNATYNTPTLMDHGFSDSYMPWLGGTIKGQINSMRSLLVQPEKDFECQDPEDVPIVIKTLPATQITDTSARLHGEVVNGKMIDAWYVWASGTARPNCYDYSNDYDGEGIWNKGDIFSGTQYGFVSGRIYYYRACGKRKDGTVSQGNIVTFIPIFT